jgi:hypothetical protein
MPKIEENIMRTANVNPAAHELLAAWASAKECERQWAEHRRSLEEQILSLHPNLVEDLEQTLIQSQGLSTSVGLDKVAVEVKRTIELDQGKVAEVLVRHPDLFGTVFRAKYEIASSKALFGWLNTKNEAPEGLLTFKTQRPYFTCIK